MRTEVQRPERPHRPVLRHRVKATECDCRALAAFHVWQEVTLPAESGPYSWMFAFDPPAWDVPPAGKIAVIELVTATVWCSPKEAARLRMYTSLGPTPSNLDLTLQSCGEVGAHHVWMCTHSLRAYTDNSLEFNVNRDDPKTEGSITVCVSGYFVDAS